ncbi:MAG: hypothetical protein E7324_04500 [Clostridiales bacterium]|nr:hypothetical protein [Clostridiales bacterium]
MRKLIFTLVFFALLTAIPALGETYILSDIHAYVELPDDTYELVLTPDNLKHHTAYLNAQNMDYDATYNAFLSEGILLQATDTDNNRTLVITAKKDVDAQMYFDLNNQDDDMRREFRLAHSNGIGYNVLGYSYSSAAWKNYGGTTLRFLQTKYSLHQEGQQVCTGYQRRTIRNGYTITLDMQVTGRNAKDTDNTALEKIMKGFGFSQILEMPDLPIKLALSSPPPTETNSDTFTITGSTEKNAVVTATLFSLTSSASKSFNVSAGSSGDFKLKITLPSQGVYSLTLTAQTPGTIPAQRIFAVTYQRGLLPVDLFIVPGETLGDTTTISGSTISGAKVSVSVNGPIVTDKSSTKSNFSFTLDTSKEGTYIIILSVTKKGLESRSFSYTATRTLTDAERIQRIRSSAKKIDYSKLKSDSNKGKNVVYTGYIVDITPTIGNEHVVTFALSKSGSNYKNLIYVICDGGPGFEAGEKCKLYAMADGTYSVLTNDGKDKTYPKVQAHFFESAD